MIFSGTTPDLPRLLVEYERSGSPGAISWLLGQRLTWTKVIGEGCKTRRSIDVTGKRGEATPALLGMEAEPSSLNSSQHRSLPSTHQSLIAHCYQYWTVYAPYELTSSRPYVGALSFVGLVSASQQQLPPYANWWHATLSITQISASRSRSEYPLSSKTALRRRARQIDVE